MEYHIIPETLFLARADYVLGDVRSRRYASAKRWIFSDAQREMGFVWCCRQLGLDHQAVRRQISLEREAVASVRRRR